MRQPTFGKQFRDRTVEELVKHEHGLDTRHDPSRRGCGCATALAATAVVLVGGARVLMWRGSPAVHVRRGAQRRCSTGGLPRNGRESPPAALRTRWLTTLDK